MKTLRWFFAAALLLAPAPSSLAQTLAQSETTLGPSGLPLPRFASLSAGEANLRAGPGERYPVHWVYRKKAYPVLITAEYEGWRRIRDAEGTEGWFSVALLSGKRTALVTGEVRSFREAPAADARVVFRAEPGVVGEILECRDGWCRLKVGDNRGWAPMGDTWGTFEGEAVE
jgi:SH3-like domain-containing protein